MSAEAAEAHPDATLLHQHVDRWRAGLIDGETLVNESVATLRRFAEVHAVPFPGEAELRSLRTEVDCRIEHGAQTNGHLEYVRARLDTLLGDQPTQTCDCLPAPK